MRDLILLALLVYTTGAVVASVGVAWWMYFGPGWTHYSVDVRTCTWRELWRSHWHRTRDWVLSSLGWPYYVWRYYARR